MKKILIINLFIFLVLFGFLEIASYIYLKNDARDYVEEYNKFARINNQPLLTQRYAPVEIFDQKSVEKIYRHTNLGDENKYSVFFWGCSYMYGINEEEENTIPYVINKLTNRTTINRAIPGGSILNMLYDLKHDSFYNQIVWYPKPKYIIFLYINDHINRISNPYQSSIVKSENPIYKINPRYKEKNGELVEVVPPKYLCPFYCLYTVKTWHWLYAQRFSSETANDKLLYLFKEAKRITDEKFPDTKFVIIDYQDGGHKLMNNSLKEKFIQNGFMVLNAEDLAGHELNSEKWRNEKDKEHPNSAAFYDVSKGLIKKLKL